MFDPELSAPPETLPNILRLVRVYSHLQGIFCSAETLYLGSHWRNGRSFPCLRHILHHCPWCKGLPRRDHAYLGVLVALPNQQPYRAVIELPPATLAAAMPIGEADGPFGLRFSADRGGKRSPLRLTISSENRLTPTEIRPTTTFDVLRCLSRVYALPDPLESTARATWQLQVQIRVDDPNYSPAVRQPQED
jgi:hypothetical protein